MEILKIEVQIVTDNLVSYRVFCRSAGGQIFNGTTGPVSKDTGRAELDRLISVLQVQSDTLPAPQKFHPQAS